MRDAQIVGAMLLLLMVRVVSGDNGGCCGGRCGCRLRASRHIAAGQGLQHVLVVSSGCTDDVGGMVGVIGVGGDGRSGSSCWSSNWMGGVGGCYIVDGFGWYVVGNGT